MGEKPTAVDESTGAEPAEGKPTKEQLIGEPDLERRAVEGRTPPDDAGNAVGGDPSDSAKSFFESRSNALGTEPALDSAAGTPVYDSDIGLEQGPVTRQAHELTHVAQQGQAAGEGPLGPGGPAEATNLNSSKSNIYRQGTPEGGDPDEPASPDAARATTVQSSKPNTSD